MSNEQLVIFMKTLSRTGMHISDVLAEGYKMAEHLCAEKCTSPISIKMHAASMLETTIIEIGIHSDQIIQ